MHCRLELKGKFMGAMKIRVFEKTASALVLLLGCAGLIISLSVEGCGIAVAQSSNESGSVKSLGDYLKAVYSPAGPKLALMNRDRIEVVNTDTNRLSFQIKPQQGYRFIDLIFSPDGHLLGTVSAGKSEIDIVAESWNADTGQRQEQATAPESAASDWLESLALPFKMKAFEARARQESRLKAPLWVRLKSVTDTVNDETLAVDLSRHQPLERSFPDHISISPQNRWQLVHRHYWEPPRHIDKVFLREMRGKEVTREIELEGIGDDGLEIYSSVAFSFSDTAEDSGMTAFTTKIDRAEIKERTVAVIYHVGDPKPKRVIDPPEDYGGISALLFSRDSKRLIIAGCRKFGIYCLRTGRLLHEGELPGKCSLGGMEVADDTYSMSISNNDRSLIVTRQTGSPKTITLPRF